MLYYILINNGVASIKNIAMLEAVGSQSRPILKHFPQTCDKYYVSIRM